MCGLSQRHTDSRQGLTLPVLPVNHAQTGNNRDGSIWRMSGFGAV